MKHVKADCNNVDPNSEKDCPVCMTENCEDKECIREKGHSGFHVSKEDLPKPDMPNKFNDEILKTNLPPNTSETGKK